MYTRCFCDKCRGALVSIQTKQNHQRKQLKNETISEQFQRKCEVLPATHHSAGPSLLVPLAHLRLPSGTSTPFLDVPRPPGTLDQPGSAGLLAQDSALVSDLDGYINIFYDTSLGILSSTVDVNPENVHVHEGEYIHEDDYDFPDEDTLLDNADLGNMGNHLISPVPLVSDPSEDDPDPFVVGSPNRQGFANPQEPRHDAAIPAHLLVVYALITWLHLQFHLPHVACNAVLTFLALFLRFFKLAAVPPFITL